jgi:hypothetical protein
MLVFDLVHQIGQMLSAVILGKNVIFTDINHLTGE